MARASKSTKSTKKSSGGRGSKEAIEKRRVARQLNTLLAGGPQKRTLDGRTEKRRQRLVKELKNGRNGEPLKPHDVLQRTHELLEIGETMASLRKQGVKPLRVEFSDEALEVVRRHAKAFNFDPRAWRMLGLQVDADGNVLPTSKRRTPSANKGVRNAAKSSTRRATKKSAKNTRKNRSRG